MVSLSKGHVLWMCETTSKHPEILQAPFESHESGKGAGGGKQERKLGRVGQWKGEI